jgi:2Fe-2S ferredoxin
MSYKCTFWPSGEVIELAGEESLLIELKKAGKSIKSSCGGCASCSDCIVVVKSGEDQLTPPPFEEIRLLGNVFHITRERLSCQTKIKGPITLDISHHEKKKLVNAEGKKPDSKKLEESGPKKAQVIVRKREELQENALKSQEKNQEKPSADWYRHWEKKDPAPSASKQLGGNRRPKSFKYHDQVDIPDEKDKKDN